MQDMELSTSSNGNISIETKESVGGNNSHSKGKQVASPENAETNMAKPVMNTESIYKQAKDMIEQVNRKRKRDAILLSDIKSSLENQVKNSYEKISQQMLSIYNNTEKTLEPKLAELFAILERISKLEQELQEFRNMLHTLYQDTQN
ncbi:uncharacterized protein LOC111621271 isoform X2 [Centruroides sculpturatus]|nr:uncharacterized protein LOC111621271 isoform X2 [Centruroides sculpturatus]